MNTICVKITRLAECANGKLTTGLDYTEYYAPLPLDKSAEFDAWSKIGDNGIYMPTVGEHGEWLNWWSVDFPADRLTVDCGGSWTDNSNALWDAIDACMESGVERMLTLGNDEDFATFRLTPLARIPAYCRANYKAEQGIDVPERIHAIVDNAIRKANGDPEIPLPLTTYRVRYYRTDEGYVDVAAASEDEAEDKAREMWEQEGVWLQSDPDRTDTHSWKFEATALAE